MSRLTSSLHTRAARSFWLLLAAGALLLIAGCAPGAGSTGAPTTAQTSQTATPAPTAKPKPTITATPAPGTTRTGCPAATQQVNWTPAPAVIITLPQASPAQVKVGQTFEIALKMGQKWTRVPQTAAIMRLDTPAGYGDAALQSCVWHFTALSSGQAHVDFSAQPLCPKGTECPTYIHLVDITVQIS